MQFLIKRARLLLLLGAIGVLLGSFSVPASASPAVTPATAYKCGSQCNGHSPSWAIPSNGVQCKNSQTLIATGHPAFDMKTPVDTSVTMHVYYSTVCQTLWATISRTASSTDYSCGYAVERTASPTYEHDGGCAAKGSSFTTPMIDDANGGNVAGWVEVTTQWVASDGSKHGGYFEKKY